ETAIGHDRVHWVRGPFAKRIVCIEDRQFVPVGSLSFHHTREHPPGVSVVMKRGIRRDDVAHDHLVQGPVGRKGGRSIYFDRAVATGLRNHEDLAFMLEEKRVRQVVSAIEHHARRGLPGLCRWVQREMTDDTTSGAIRKAFEKQMIFAVLALPDKRIGMKLARRAGKPDPVPLFFSLGAVFRAPLRRCFGVPIGYYPMSALSEQFLRLVQHLAREMTKRKGHGGQAQQSG